MDFHARLGLFAIVATAFCSAATFSQEAQNQRRPITFQTNPQLDREQNQRAPQFPAEWYKIDPDTEQVFDNWLVTEGRPMPPISLDGWVANEVDLDDLQGKVVVVDFWSARCGPCIAGLPQDNKLAKRLAKQDVIWLSIHDHDPARNRLPTLVQQFKLSFALAVDDHGFTSEKWRVPAHPFYFVIDRNGIVRAAGLKRKHIRDVVEKVLAEKHDAADSRAMSDKPKDDREPFVVPDTWLESPAEHRQAVAKSIDLDDPPLPEAGTWLNTTELTAADLKGKVVMLDFWATWCAPCIRSIPYTNDLYERYKAHGFEIIGVCHQRGVERMSQVVEQSNIAYPVFADADGKITESYVVNSWPDYYFIDRAGRLRVIDCRQQRVEDVIKGLLSEPAPQVTKPTNNTTTSGAAQSN